jgi:hypothetical protein
MQPFYMASTTGKKQHTEISILNIQNPFAYEIQQTGFELV